MIINITNLPKLMLVLITLTLSEGQSLWESENFLAHFLADFFVNLGEI